jgi:hypothetical protein
MFTSLDSTRKSEAMEKDESQNEKRVNDYPRLPKDSSTSI